MQIIRRKNPEAKLKFNVIVLREPSTDERAKGYMARTLLWETRKCRTLDGMVKGLWQRFKSANLISVEDINGNTLRFRRHG